jgi:hypothetical protein
LLSTWEKLKTGQVINPKWLALILAVAAIIGGWWWLSKSSKKADSALWVNYDLAVSPDGMKAFTEDKSTADTDAARYVRVNLQRNKIRDGLYNLTADKLATRLKAAKSLEEARDELTRLADEFKNDRTMKAVCFLAAAEAEKGLIGVPKEGVRAMGLDVKANCRGQVERYAELKRKAAEAIGPTTEAGQKYTAEADKYTKEAGDIYNVSGILNAAFNEADPEERKPDLPTPPTGLTPSTPGDAPRTPDKLPDPAKPDKKKPEEEPKTPTENPPTGTSPEKK